MQYLTEQEIDEAIRDISAVITEWWIGRTDLRWQMTWDDYRKLVRKRRALYRMREECW